jgi:hypothetical protein
VDGLPGHELQISIYPKLGFANNAPPTYVIPLSLPIPNTPAWQQFALNGYVLD